MSSPELLPRDVGVIVVAAGRGTRLGVPPKQYREIAGVPMLLRALRPFLSHPSVDSVVAVLPREDAADPPAWLKELQGERLRIVAGGAERVDSVQAGLRTLPPGALRVLVHDAARPFPDPGVIDAILDATRRGVGAVAAIPILDTVKRVRSESDGAVLVEQTMPREMLWRAQTPQGFPRPLLERAHAARRDSGPAMTDDAEMVERLGERVEIVPDTALNLKVTTVEDFVLAEAIAAWRR